MARRAALAALALVPLAVGCGGDEVAADAPEAAPATATATVTVTEPSNPPLPTAPVDGAILGRVADGIELIEALAERSLAACDTPACSRAVLAGIAGVAEPERAALVGLVREATEPCAREVGGRYVRLVDAYRRAAQAPPGGLGPRVRDAGDGLRLLGHLRGACADLMGAGARG